MHKVQNKELKTNQNKIKMTQNLLTGTYRLNIK